MISSFETAIRIDSTIECVNDVAEHLSRMFRVYIHTRIKCEDKILNYMNFQANIFEFVFIELYLYKSSRIDYITMGKTNASKIATEISWADKWKVFKEIVSFTPNLFALTFILTLSSAVLEGIGLSFILPIIEIVESGKEAGALEAEEGLLYWFVTTYDVLGIPFSLGTVILGVLLVMLVRFTVTFFARYLSSVMAEKFRCDLQEKVFSNALETKISFFDQHGTDEIINVVVTQARRVNLLFRRLFTLLENSLMSLIYLALATYIAPFLMLIIIIVFSFIFLVFNYSITSGEEIGDNVASANENIQHIAQSALQGIREVKVFNQKYDFKERFKNSINNYFSNRLIHQKNKQLINNFFNYVTFLAVFGLIFIALNWELMELSSLGVFLVSLFRLAPLLSNFNSKVYDTLAEVPHFIRTKRFLKRLEPLNHEARNEKLLEPVTTVSFDGVTFSYIDEVILSGISFSIESGDTVAFVGSTGAGKSTIADLLTGFYPEYSGEILINSTELRDLDLQDWWSHISIVRQSPYIFNETLRNNLLVANETASEEQMRNVMQTALVSDFFDDLENGLETQLGDRGVRLSGGQSQRVAIARALLSDSDLYILDEATSALDYDTEEKLYQNLQSYFANKTVIVIAHRLSTVKNADKIFHLEDGAIRESGQHEELLERQGAYYSLYQSRSGDT